MQSVIRFLKNVWTVLFDANVLARSHALKELAPRLWERVWCTGHTRASEQLSYRHNRDMANLAATNLHLRSQINQRGAGGKFTKRNP